MEDCIRNIIRLAHGQDGEVLLRVTLRLAEGSIQPQGQGLEISVLEL